MINVKNLLISTVILLSAGSLSSCGGSSSDGSGTSSGDTTPDAFSFIDQNDVELNSSISSNSVTITGVSVDTPISISNGEYSIDGGSFTNANSSISNNQTVIIRQTSSTSFSTLSTSLLTVGSESAGFSLTTGDVGTGFNKAKGFNSSVTTLLATNDGSNAIYVGGHFTGYKGNDSKRIIRLKSDGTVDPSFIVNSGFNSYVRIITAATDGSNDVYVGGNFTRYNGATSTRIIRLNSDGTVDTTFNVGTGFNSTVFSIAVTNDGSNDVYVGGYFTAYNGTSSPRLIRLNSDGSIDSTFNVGTGFNHSVDSITLATDGSNDIYVGGNFINYNGTLVNRIARLNNDGSIDTSFNVGSGFNSSVQSILIANDGSNDVYIGGGFTTFNGGASSRIIRLNDDGSLDTTLGLGTIGFNTLVNSIVYASDGSNDLYIGGFFNNYKGISSNKIIRLNSNGSIDSAFDIGTGFSGQVNSIINNPDGSNSVYAAGSFHSYNGKNVNGLTRLNALGVMDTAYDLGGGFDSRVYTISPAIDGSNDIYAGGSFTLYNGQSSKGIVRLNGDDGTIDSAFNVGLGFNSTVILIVPATDGSNDIYAAGSFTSYNGSTHNFFIRLNDDGSVDTSFNTGTGFDSTVNSIVIATDGSNDIYVGGYFTSYNGNTSNRIIRLNSDGSVDTAFNVGTGFDSQINQISLAKDGSGDLYISGDFTLYNGTGSNRAIRLNNDGSLDTLFNIGTGFDRRVYSIIVAPDGSNDVYVGGNFTDYNGTPSKRLIRLNSDASIDSAFNVGTSFNNSSAIYFLNPSIDGSNDIYVAGNFKTYQNVSTNHILRLNDDGSTDATFNVGTGFDQFSYNIIHAADSSGDVFLGGVFTSYQDVAVDYLVRLNPDGSLN